MDQATPPGDKGEGCGQYLGSHGKGRRAGGCRGASGGAGAGHRGPEAQQISRAAESCYAVRTGQIATASTAQKAGGRPTLESELAPGGQTGARKLLLERVRTIGKHFDAARERGEEVPTADPEVKEMLRIPLRMAKRDSSAGERVGKLPARALATTEMANLHQCLKNLDAVLLDPVGFEPSRRRSPNTGTGGSISTCRAKTRTQSGALRLTNSAPCGRRNSSVVGWWLARFTAGRAFAIAGARPT